MRHQTKSYIRLTEQSYILLGGDILALRSVLGMLALAAALELSSWDVGIGSMTGSMTRRLKHHRQRVTILWMWKSS